MIQRSERLHKIIKNIAKKRNSRWLNWEGNILIDEIDDDGKPKGRNQYYKSITIEKYNENVVNNTKEGKDNYSN